MTAQLLTHKRLLTRFTNRLDHIVEKIRAEKLEEFKPDPSIPSEEWADSVEEAIKAIETIMGKVEKELFDLAVALDTQAEISQDEQREYEQYSAKAEDAIAKAFDHLILLQSRRHAMKSRSASENDRSVQQSLQQGSPALAATVNHQMQTKTVELPPLPIPSFAGNIWEWDNFWEIFSTNIHSRDLPEMVKYNYLLDALKGEARESIMKFRVSSDNYSKAIECLLKKYNNKETLINQLVEKLEACALRTPSIKDQRSLLEQLQAITSQLQDKGEDVNSSWLVKRVLTKFPDSIKRKVICKRQGVPSETPFTMAQLFQMIDDTLSAEEMFQVFAEKTPTPIKDRNLYGKKRPNPAIMAKCMYCKGDHSSNQCTKYTTPQERSSYLRRNKLCLICASSSHVSTQCKGRLCFSCNGPHHTSCCFKQRVQTSSSPSQEQTGSRNKTGTSGRKETPKGSQRSVRSNAIITQETDNTEQEAPILSAQMVLNAQYSHHSCLPSGELTVMDPENESLFKVDVLFDTGAEISFIDSSLAERLHLRTLGEKRIRINTFGTKEVVERQCKRVLVDVWDQEGSRHHLELLTYDILTQPFAPPSLLAQDQDFLRNLNLPINLCYGKQLIKPSILLGCDLLWSLVRDDMPLLPLPSGLHILPTKLGYLVCGKTKTGDNSVLQIAQYKDNEVDRWEQYWTMNTAQVCTVVESDKITQEEREQWDQYWTMDSAGTEEFLGPEKEAQNELDKLVWRRFEESIERRQDGYYVRLPWKEQNPRLPDNRALAYKRLINIWTSLKKDEQLLDQYNNVFQEQLNKGILERVDDEDQDEGTTVHYIPHQPVLTPHKSTTKLRIVFDASAHYKGSPSLNDALYRGPVILPSLYGLLLRFRIGKIALISDVEKAFLQVRLHEEDRDATRCLWLKDHKKPPSTDNTRTLRFTRVTFGLKSSPFLLAGTTHYHLDRHEDEGIAEQIKDNLYVDNVLQTFDTSEEALHFYNSAKAIFGELNMNLREFSSNSTEVANSIPDEDKANSHCPKVLGIEWNASTDMLEARCSMKKFATTNKRTITSAIATIYDPMGWYIPLLHRAKVFLQSLWKDQYEWDACLPKEKVDEWVKISGELNGYQKLIPRFLVPKMTQATLVVFADASATGMAACAYLHHPQGAHLLMAKSKLPPLHANTTIPKLEMNAITLAARLANSIVAQLKKVLSIGEVYILSDSEIALCWIKSPLSRDFGIFVHNRLTEIRKIVSHLACQQCITRFGHVSSGENPADCGTRGLTKDEFRQHSWWTGPSWLQSDPIRWPIRETIFGCDSDGQEDNESDSAEVVAAAGVVEYDPELLQPGQVKTLTQAKRIIAYALRFVRSTAAMVSRKGPHKIRTGIPDIPSGTNPSFLCGTEVEFAGKVIIKAHQTLRVTNNIRTALKDLNIREDEEGVLRCYGRLGRAQLKFAAKYPAFILQKTVLANIIIREAHQQGHTGINHTIGLVRQQFWIPQLRSQVQKLIRTCVKCQRFNNLPYRYPPQGDLPKERVVRSRPFQYVGLDYFGPLSIMREDGNQGNCYGSIIPCMVTRLLHLDIVSDLSTVAFLRMLRRFFARRGIPQTITSDNAPSFLLGEEILKETLQAARTDPLIGDELSSRGIDWKHITPYAPWQGGFYERLIKSVKHSLYKTIGRATVSFDELNTVMTEIEAILNTRPLTYETTDLDRDQVIRPIDFLQKDICLSYPLPLARRDDQDLDYIPPEDRMAIQTKRQAVSALETSCKMTEKFWNVWQNQYLTSLREKHILNIGRKKGCKQHPQKDALVLICETALPRHSWKMGIIHELVANAQGTVREAVVRLPSHRLIRRPINLLVPLELEDDTREEHDMDNVNNTGDTQMDDRTTRAEEPQQRYNLRPRKNINYKEYNSLHLSSLLCFFTLLQGMILLMLMCISAVSAVEGTSTIPYFKRDIRCFEGGVILESDERIPYEICADQFCITLEAPNLVEKVTFPPDVVLHEYRVQWKFTQDRKVATIETNCPASQFCEAVDCTFCSANILNPECWPVRAILALAVIIYFVLTGCYVFLYVPLVVGRPFRVIAAIAWMVLRGLLRIVKSMLKKTNTGRANRRRRLAEIIAILGIISHSVHGCQLVNVFNHVSNTCTNTASGQCSVHLSEVFKINPFKQEACVRLSHNSNPVHEIRLTWKSLDLICEPVTDFFTRDTVYRIVNSKRCSSKGSCHGEKCGSINASSLLPELEEGNKFPGNTACFESCGGLGCGCLTPSSGCLFYRIYLEPVNDVVYEIFHCARWKEMAKIRITHFDGNKKTTSTLTTELVPNIPKKWNSLSLTLTSLSLPPLFLLSTPFIKAEREIAMWKQQASPALQCQTYANAQNLTCPVIDECNCRPAEIRVNCDCRDFPIGQWFSDIKNQLPATFPSLSFRRYGKTILARISSMVTSEVVMDFQGYYEPTILVDDAVCEIRDAALTGCYNCEKGARARVKCFASRDHQQAEVICNNLGFSVPCNTTGSASIIRLSFSEAQIRLECSVSCGKLAKTFELEGILKFTGTVTGMVQYWLQGHSASWSTIPWPDFFHIGAVFLQWYKTLTATIIGVAVILGLTYLVLSTWGIKIATWLLLLGPRIIMATAQFIVRILRHVIVNKRHSKQY